MKKCILILGILFFSLQYALADDFCDTLRYAELRAADGTFLGYLTNNSADLNSIACTYGDYGASYALNSIFTPYGTYGASYQLNSPRCSYCLDAPYIIQGDVYWRLSLNKAVIGGLNPFEVLARCFISPFDKRLEPYKDLDKDNVLLYYQIKACQSDFGINSTVAEERGKCKCKDGYKWDQYGTSCVPMTEDEKCKSEFGDYAYSPEPGYCNCIAGYEWNWNKTSCKKSATNYNDTTYYPTVDTTTVTTVDCSGYGPNAIATNNGQCVCKTDFEWNYNKNWCVADRNNKLYGGKDFRNAKDGGDYINMLLDFEEEIEEKSNTKNNTEISTNKTDELQEAILWMYEKGLTIFNEPVSFKAYNGLRRDEAAKFFVQYAKQVMGKTPDYSKKGCTFNDLNQAWSDLKDVIVESCQLGLFQGHNGKFMPTQQLTNAQAITVFMRLLEGYKDESGTHFANNYYESAHAQGFLHDTPLDNKAYFDNYTTRGNVAKMLFRGQKSS